MHTLLQMPHFNWIPDTLRTAWRSFLMNFRPLVVSRDICRKSTIVCPRVMIWRDLVPEGLGNSFMIHVMCYKIIEIVRSM